MRLDVRMLMINDHAGLFLTASAAVKKAASEAGRDGTKTVKANTFTGLSLDESKQILNVSSLDDIQSVRKVSHI